MGKRIFVGNLAYSTTDDSLRAHFEAKGHEVRKATVVLDRETGRSRGFAFVDFDDTEDLEAIIAANHERDLDGRRVTVTEAVERPRPGGPGGGPRGPRPGPGGDGPRSSYGDRPRGPGGYQGGGGDRAGGGDRSGPGGYAGSSAPAARRPPIDRDSGPPPRPYREGPPPDVAAGPDGDAQSRKRREKHAPKRRDETRPTPRRGERDEERRPNNKWRGGRGWEADDDDDE